MFPFPFSFVAPTASGLADIDNVYSMEFDGVDDYIVTGLDLAYTVVPNISLSCWVKIDKSGLTNYASYYPVCVYSNSFVNGSPIRIYSDNASGGAATVVLIADQSGTTASTTDLGDNQWHHIVETCEYDAGGTICNVYIDGTKEITNSLLRDYAPLTGNLVIGGRGITTATTMFYKGFLDEVAAFDYILTQDQVDEIYNATSTGKTADLSTMATPPVAWYRMGD
jgi:hypothetical protein